MKIIPLFILLLFAGNLKAQSHIWTREDAKKANFHVDLLPVSYTTTFPLETSEEFSEKLGECMGSVLSERADPGIGVFVQVLINDRGSVDYLIFDAEQSKGYNRDSLNQLLKTAFEKDLTKWQMASKPEKPFQFMTFRFFGKRIVHREVRQADSSVTTIKDAQAFVDTLKIKRVFFNQLELTAMPDVVYRFPNTEELYLSGNNLEKLVIDFARLPRLKQLHLQNNKLTGEGLVLSKNKTLEVLNLRENKLTDIPAAARNCKKVSSLWLGGNQLKSLSNRSFRKLKQVKDLNFYKSELVVLPRGIRKMKNLEVLDLYYNRFESLPNSLTRLKKLTHLAISHNQLKTLPAKMNRLKNVHTFYAHHNRLSVLPESVAKMRKVNILDLGFNWFTNFPAEVASLQDLKELDISSNNFPDFPAKLLDIKKLDKVYLQGNPFVGKDMDIKYEHQLGVLKGKNVEVFY